MVEKEKLIKWLEVEWLEPLYHHAKSFHRKTMDGDNFSDMASFYKSRGAFEEISAMLDDIKAGKLDCFNHKGCQKI